MGIDNHKKGSRLLEFLRILIIIVGVSITLTILFTWKEGDNKTNNKQSSVKDEISASLTLNYEWYTTGFGNIMEINLSINNQSNYDIKDIEIACNLYGKSGTLIDTTNAVIYEVIKRKSKKRIEEFNMGFIHKQASNAGCEISDFKLIL